MLSYLVRKYFTKIVIISISYAVVLTFWSLSQTKPSHCDKKYVFDHENYLKTHQRRKSIIFFKPPPPPNSNYTRKVVFKDNNITMQYLDSQFSSEKEVKSWNEEEACITSESSCTRMLVNGTVKNNPQGVQQEFVEYQQPKINIKSKFNDKYRKEPEVVMGCAEIQQQRDKSKSEGQFQKFDGSRFENADVMLGQLTDDTGKKVQVLFVEAKSDKNKWAYRRLSYELEFRRKIGNNMPGLIKLYGMCFTAVKASMIVEHSNNELLCDVPFQDKNFYGSECQRNIKLHTKIRRRLNNDKTGEAMFTFLKSFFCLIGEMESRGFVLENFHGSNFGLRPDFSVYIDNLQSAVYHGSRPLYGDTVCIKHDNCYQKTSKLWNNGSVNHHLYRACVDSTPYCQMNKCVGFSASSHMCAIAEWFLPFALEYIPEDAQKIRGKLTRMIRQIGNPYPDIRKSGQVACIEIDNIRREYDHYMKYQYQRKVNQNLDVAKPRVEYRRGVPIEVKAQPQPQQQNHAASQNNQPPNKLVYNNGDFQNGVVARQLPLSFRRRPQMNGAG